LVSTAQNGEEVCSSYLFNYTHFSSTAATQQQAVLISLSES